jgi:head-tail adaptor
MTDEAGRYQQETIRGDTGAVIGRHRVRIRTRQEEMDANDRVKVARKEEVPPRYNVRTELFIDVPSGGSDGANFDLTSETRKRRR